jgi:transcriptional regulator with XRE-family HTH domain
MDHFTFSERIRSERKARGWSQQHLADAAGVSRARLEALENGRARDVTFSTASQLLEALGLEFRIGTANRGRPTLEELRDADRLGE